MHNLTYSISRRWFLLIPLAFLLFSQMDWEYGYYQILRWSVFLVSAYLLIELAGTKQYGHVVWFVALAVLFNPILPISFSRASWALLDYLAAFGLLVSLFTLKPAPRT